MKESMQSRVRAYLEQRRSLGYKLRIEGQMLINFACYADSARHRGPLTRQLALRWAAQPPNADRLYHARRLEVLRVFARHQAALEPSTEILPRHVFGPAHRRHPPHLYSPAQIRRLLRGASKLPGRLRSKTYRTLISLLACTGLRISEALSIELRDVDLIRGVLTIRNSKYHHTRLVPLHPTALTPLRRYAQARGKLFPAARHFFVSDRGQPFAYSTVRTVFRELARDLISNSGRPHVRLHDLRHTFACRVLLRFQRSKRGTNGRIVILSRYLGHERVNHTYWYLTATPDLLRESTRHFEARPNEDPDFANLLQRFFSEHLIQQRNVSPCTVAAYRDTFRLFLRYLKGARRRAPARLPLESITVDSVLAFLSYLEKDRHNSARSRNARLAAIRSFVHFSGDLLGSELPSSTRRILRSLANAIANRFSAS